MAHEIFSADRILKKNRLTKAGLTDAELSLSLVIILCEQGCNAEVEHIKHGIMCGGGATLVIDMPLLSDMAAEGAGKNSLLLAREAVADLTESLLNMYSADGVAIVASSQTAAAGMVMGAIRSNTPLAFLPAFFTGAYYPSRLLNLKAKVSCGKEGIAKLEDLSADINCGRSMEMDNLNGLCIFLEGCGIAAADSVGAFSIDEKIRAARRCGTMAARRAAELSYPRRELSAAVFDCGIAAYIMAGGTAAGLLDVLAIANENLIEIDLRHIESISERLPLLAAVSPLGRFNIAAFSRAGGTFALLKEAAKIPKLLSPSVKIDGVLLSDLLDRTELKQGIINPSGSNGTRCYCNDSFDTDFTGKNAAVSVTTVSGKNASASACLTKNPVGLNCDEVICKLENPVTNEGGFGLLKGNLFDYGVFNRNVADKVFKGTAAVFDSEEHLRAAVLSGSISGGDVAGSAGVGSLGNALGSSSDGGTAIILRGQSAKDNGMPLLDLQSAVNAALLNNVVIITDGRVIASGGCTVISLCFGEGLAAVKNGDPIEIDFKKGKINLNIPGKEINNRLKKIKNINESLFGGLLRYASLVNEPNTGCILRRKF